MNNQNNGTNNIDINSMFSNMNAINQQPTPNNNEIQNVGTNVQNTNVVPAMQVTSQQQTLPQQNLNNGDINGQQLNTNPTQVTPNLTPVFPNEVVVGSQNSGQQVEGETLTNNVTDLTFSLPGEETNINVQPTSNNIVTEVPIEAVNQPTIQPVIPQVNEVENLTAQPELVANQVPPVQTTQVETQIPQTQNIEPTAIATSNNMNATNNVNNAFNDSNVTSTTNVAVEQPTPTPNLPTQENTNANTVSIEQSQQQNAPAAETKPIKVKKPFNKLYLIYGLIIVVLFAVLIMMLTKIGPFKEEVVTPPQTNTGIQNNISPDSSDDDNDRLDVDMEDEDLDASRPDKIEDPDSTVGIDSPDEPLLDEEDLENPTPGGPRAIEE